MLKTFSLFFQDWIKSSKYRHLFEIEISFNLLNVLSVTFDQFNRLLLNRSVKKINAWIDTEEKKSLQKKHKKKQCVF